MSSLAALLLRITANPPYATKGATLSYSELDANLILIADCITALNQVPPGSNLGIPAYSSGTEYSQGDFVTFGNNIWEYINAVPSTGNTPAEGAFWSLRSAGIFAHLQNTDTGTNQNTFAIGDGAASDKLILANNADVDKPAIRYDETTSKWQFANDGITFVDMGTGGTAIIAEIDTISVINEFTPTAAFTSFLDIQLSGQSVNLNNISFVAGVITFNDGADIGEGIKIIGKL